MTAVLEATRPAYHSFPVRVADIRPLSPSFVRVTFAGDELQWFGTEGLDQRIKLVVPLPGRGVSGFPGGEDWYSEWRALPEEQRNPLRTYTVRAVRPELGEVDVDVVLHGATGPASRWILTQPIGEEAVLVGPDSRSDHRRVGIEWAPGDARTLVLAGDETAVPAICAILESLPADASGCALLEVPESGDELEIDAPEGMRVVWLPRTGGAAYGSALVQAVRSWSSASLRPSGTGGPVVDEPESEIVWDVPEPLDHAELYAWVAGESSTIKAVRRHLVSDRGVDRRSVAFMGYWRAGRSEN